MSDGKPRQAFGGTHANPIGCDANALQPVIQALNEALCTHGALDHQYRKHHWLVRGPQWRELHQHLADSFQQVLADMDDIAERIVMLGGIPESHPARHVERSAFPYETAANLPVRAQLENDQAAEMLLCQQLRRCIHAALDVHDYGTETLLKGVLRHAEQRADDLDHLLDADSLETRQAQQPRKAA